jgi:hypothetical protein
VKVEQNDMRALDALAKRQRCAVIVIHHSSKGSAGLDWSEKAAGTFAMSAATESQTHISRFTEFEAPLYPLVRQLHNAFGKQPFSPKEMTQQTGLSIATVHRQLDRLARAGAIQKQGYGNYVLSS